MQVTTAATRQKSTSSWLIRLTLGIVLNAVAWVSAWTHCGPLAHYSFFPLWLGFILIVDAITAARSGTSLWCRGKAQLVSLFVVSAPFWWYFEQVNARVGNWHYVTFRPFATGEYIFWASLAFSTVIPAVLTVTELLGTFGWITSTALHVERLPVRLALAILATGMVTFALSLLFPRQCYPLLWMSLLFTLDPINNLAGEASIAALIRARAYACLLRLMAAGLICGFFWEMWNARSLPKWYYTVPYVGFGHLFEMPVLGYGGYLSFALEIYAVYNVVRLISRPLHLFPRDYVRI